MDNGVFKAGVTVIVVVPSAIRATPTTPLPQANQLVKGVALAMNADTPLPFFNLPAPKVFLTTGYFVPLQVPVLDQFGNPLNQIYVGTSVSESSPATGNTFQPIHRELQAGNNNGVFYIDPVGGKQDYYNQNGLPVFTTNPVDPTMNGVAADVATFLATGTGQALKQNEHATQNIDVQIGGIKLVHGVTNRKWFATKEGNNVRVKIVW
jgi:hypothetical protein